jgi:very-short-patch-repair endonuclease
VAAKLSIAESGAAATKTTGVGHHVSVDAGESRRVGKVGSGLELAFLAQCEFLKVDGYVMEYRFHATRRWRFDFAWPTQKIAVEIEGGTWSGGRHTRGSGYEKDCEKYNEAVRLGWSVLRFTGKMVKNGTAIFLIKEMLSERNKSECSSGLHLEECKRVCKAQEREKVE